MNKEEQELVKKAKRGDKESFGALYDKHLGPIYRFIFLKVGSRADAEDISHQVFLSAWQNIRRYKFQGFPFSSWLYKIALNAVVDHWRTKKPNINIDLVKEGFLAESSSEIDTELDKRFNFQLIKTALAKLEPDQQSVIIMKFIDELSNKEIAHIMKKSEGAIRVIQHRALRQLKKHIGEINEQNYDQQRNY